MPEEGHIKFKAQWTKGPPLPSSELLKLNNWRNKLYEWQFLGAYPDGIGYGNISRRYGTGSQFIITGSATGHLPKLHPKDYSLVTSVNIPRNTLNCIGPAIASSESMSHAAIYQTCHWVGGIIHIHDLRLWEQLIHRVPTTAASATYGSPEMAYSIIDLLKNTTLPEHRIFAMEGHREGIFTFGENLDAAGQVLLEAANLQE